MEIKLLVDDLIPTTKENNPITTTMEIKQLADNSVAATLEVDIAIDLIISSTSIQLEMDDLITTIIKISPAIVNQVTKIGGKCP